MVTEPGNVDACDLARLQNGHPLGDFHGIAIDEDLDGVIGVGEVDPSSGHRSPFREIRRLRRLGGCGGGFGVLELGGGDDRSD